MADKNKKTNTDVERWSAIGEWYTTTGYGNVWMPGTGLIPVADARNYYMNLYLATGKDKEDYYRIADLLIGKGYMTNRADIQGWQGWMNTVIDTAASDQYRLQKLTPLDVIELLPSSETGADGGPKSYSSTTRSTSISNRGDATVTLNNAYQQMLGRRATDKELAAFQKALNELEGKNPTVTTASSTTSAAGGSSSTSASTRSTGGFNAGQFAQEWARSRPEYAENFAATTFMGVIDNMIRGGASLEGRV